MKCPHCGTEKKPSERLKEELAGYMIPCKNPQEANQYAWIIEKLGKVLDEMVKDVVKK